MDVADFDFELPEELIAQEPPRDRGGSRLLVLDRHTGDLEDAAFADIGRFFRPGDLLAINNTRVFPARLLGRRDPSGGDVECLLIAKLPTSSSRLPSHDARVEGGGSERWEALVHPGQKLKPGSRMRFDGDGAALYAEVLARHFFGRRTVRLWTEDGSPVQQAIDRLGHIPLPPYIRRDDRPLDHDRYQTVYARDRGSIAAPTAGLHFTATMLGELRASGVEVVEITLHVGYGTFKPVRTDRVEDHVVDPEAMTVERGSADALTAALLGNRRIVAVGTTTTRALESLVLDEDRRVLPVSGPTSLFIAPGHRFRVVSGMVTNFHLPRSSLLMLVAAFAGREQALAAYRHAVAAKYRFYSYGDAMLIV